MNVLSPPLQCFSTAAKVTSGESLLPNMPLDLKIGFLVYMKKINATFFVCMHSIKIATRRWLA